MVEEVELLTRAEVAQECGVCPKTVYDWQKNKWIAPVIGGKRGAKNLYRREDVERIKQSHQKRHRWTEVA